MVNEDMRVCMFLSSTFDFYQFLLSFRDKIVDVDLLHHVCPEIIPGTQLAQLEDTVTRELYCTWEFKQNALHFFSSYHSWPMLFLNMNFWWMRPSLRARFACMNFEPQKQSTLQRNAQNRRCSTGPVKWRLCFSTLLGMVSNRHRSPVRCRVNTDEHHMVLLLLLRAMAEGNGRCDSVPVHPFCVPRRQTGPVFSTSFPIPSPHCPAAHLHCNSIRQKLVAAFSWPGKHTHTHRCSGRHPVAERQRHAVWYEGIIKIPPNSGPHRPSRTMA